MVKFSVIVPVYRVEDYLRDCVDSILSQSFREFELILVDDGSPDQCPAICDGYAQRDSRVRVLHQKNKGVSGARNTGVLAAKGEYIAFVDSDDLFCEGALEQAVRHIGEGMAPDIIMGNIIYWDGAREETIDYAKCYDGNPGFMELNEAFAKRHIQLPWAVYSHFYRADFLRANRLLFTEGLTTAEDADFYLRLLEKVNSYVFTDIFFVKYRQNRPESATTSPKFQDVWGRLTVFRAAFESAASFSDEELMRGYFADYFAHSILSVAELERESDQELCYQFIKDNDYILDCLSHRARYRIGKAAWALLGLRGGTQVLARAKRMYKAAAAFAGDCINTIRGK